MTRHRWADKAVITPNKSERECLNGCGVIINGTRTNPTIVHANIDMNPLLPKPDWDDPVAVKTYETTKKRTFYQFYLNFALAAAESEILLGSVGTSQLFDPELYYKYGGSMAKVFGIKDSSDQWTFYYSMERPTASGIQYTAGQIWPELTPP